MHAMNPMTNLAQIQAMLPNSHFINIAKEQAKGLSITKIGTDSRKLMAGELFIALQGERFDAHHFLDDVQKQGAAAAVWGLCLSRPGRAGLRSLSSRCAGPGAGRPGPVQAGSRAAAAAHTLCSAQLLYHYFSYAK